jgi:hypothetical protein
MTPPDNLTGKEKPDLNVLHRTMEQVMLDHMKLCHPEWLAELTESGELDDFIEERVVTAKGGESAPSTTPRPSYCSGGITSSASLRPHRRTRPQEPGPRHRRCLREAPVIRISIRYTFR